MVMKRCSILLIITEKQKKKKQYNEVPPHISQNGHHQKQSMKKNAREGMEKSKFSYTVGGNANQCSHYEKQWEDASKK